jgi:hypothetical protein
MKRSLYFIGLITLLQISCNDSENNESKKVTADHSDALQQNTVPENISKAKAFAQFTNLEKIFSNDNYMILSGKDTSYIYFSRSSEYLIKCYSYKMIKGDSSELKIDSIKLDAQNNVQWNFNNLKLTLENSTDLNSNWNAAGVKSAKYQFQKIDIKTIQFIVPPGKVQQTLKKTITLSTFLVRSFYDYEHGTKLAFDTANFTKK